MNRRKSTEHIEQVRFVQFVRTFHPEVICFAIPNGADVSTSQRIKLVQEGMLAGIPDVMLLARNKPTLAIEFKRPDGKGKVSTEQREVHVQMEAVGVRIETCHGYEAAKVVLADWLTSNAE